MLKGKCVVLGVTGGIAAYKAAEIVSRLKKQGVDVWVIMTRNATEFITPLTMETLCGHEVAVNMFERPEHMEVEHIALAKRADVFLVAPATANFIGKLACGIADDMLTTTAMATHAPVIIAPAMNSGMWESAAVKANMATLLLRGAMAVGPDSGLLACGDVGAGRMSEPGEIVDAVMRVLRAQRDAHDGAGGEVASCGAAGAEQGEGGAGDCGPGGGWTDADVAGACKASPANASMEALAARASGMGGENAAPVARGHDMQGLHIIVTAGPTREPIDPVRYITNRSSGRMGFAIAAEAAARGARVTLVSGPVTLPTPAGVTRLDIETTGQLHERMMALSAGSDVIIQAAAPADFRVREIAQHKLKKRDGQLMTLELAENPDIAAALGGMKRPGQTLVAFAAETQNMVSNAREKLLRKRADLIVANDVSEPGAGFDVDTNIVTLIDADTETRLPIMSKAQVAGAILDKVMELRV